MSEIFAILWQIFAGIWWVLLFFILLPLTGSTWRFWRQERFKAGLKWGMLEIRIPREIKRTPKAMEQILLAFHTLRNAPGTFKEKFIDGEVTEWISLEIVSLGGEIRYFVRFPEKKRHVLEANIYSYYPEVELAEVEDYADRFPSDYAEMKRWGYDMYGTELVLRKEPAFPIRSYVDFESMMEEAQMDPASALLEMLSKTRREEMVGIQFVIAPAGDEWHKEGRKVADGLRESKGGGGSSPKSTLKWSFEHGPLPVIEHSAPAKKEESQLPRSLMRSPGETDVLKAVETNLSRPGFDTTIRIVYFSPSQAFADLFARKGVLAAFNQYSSNDLNGFKSNPDVETRTQVWSWPHIFPGLRNMYRKQRMIQNYRNRSNPIEPWMGKLLTSHFFNWNFKSRRAVLNTMSLATLYHPPTYLVLTAPHIQRVDSRKAGPPAGLAIYGEDTDIERFK